MKQNLRCELCGEYPRFLKPLMRQQGDGILEVFACKKCREEKSFCELCDKETNTLELLLIQQGDGVLEFLACPECMEKEGLRCSIHNTPLVGFEDLSYACILCIKLEVEKHSARAEELAARLKQHLLPEESQALNEWAMVVSQIIGKSVPSCVLRLAAARAVCTKKSVETILEETIRSRRVSEILPDRIDEMIERLLA